MAAEKKKTDTTNADLANAMGIDPDIDKTIAEGKTKKNPVDYATDLGTLTYARAVREFGKDKAIQVIKTVAQIGGHGMFEDADIKSPLFGGLAMPDPSKIPPPKDEDFPATLPEREFYVEAANEEYEGFKKRAVADRAKINEYLNSVK